MIKVGVVGGSGCTGGDLRSIAGAASGCRVAPDCIPRRCRAGGRRHISGRARKCRTPVRRSVQCGSERLRRGLFRRAQRDRLATGAGTFVQRLSDRVALSAGKGGDTLFLLSMIVSLVMAAPGQADKT